MRATKLSQPASQPTAACLPASLCGSAATTYLPPGPHPTTALGRVQQMPLPYAALPHARSPPPLTLCAAAAAACAHRPTAHRPPPPSAAHHPDPKTHLSLPHPRTQTLHGINCSLPHSPAVSLSPYYYYCCYRPPPFCALLHQKKISSPTLRVCRDKIKRPPSGSAASPPTFQKTQNSPFSSLRDSSRLPRRLRRFVFPLCCVEIHCCFPRPLQLVFVLGFGLTPRLLALPPRTQRTLRSSRTTLLRSPPLLLLLPPPPPLLLFPPTPNSRVPLRTLVIHIAIPTSQPSRRDPSSQSCSSRALPPASCKQFPLLLDYILFISPFLFSFLGSFALQKKKIKKKIPANFHFLPRALIFLPLSYTHSFSGVTTASHLLSFTTRLLHYNLQPHSFSPPNVSASHFHCHHPPSPPSCDCPLTISPPEPNTRQHNKQTDIHNHHHA